MTESGPRYATPRSLRSAVDARLKVEARNRARPVNELRREWVLQRFLARVFADPQSRWIVKGGAGMLIRLPGARYSRDVDMLRPDTDAEVAVDELRDMLRVDLNDHLTFVIGTRRTPMTGPGRGLTLPVVAYTGVTEYERFTIDLSTDLHYVAKPDRRRPEPVIEVPGLPELPELTLYPLPDQVADKVCAMYETHGHAAAPSNRYRDLVDLVLITNTFAIDAGQTAEALASEARRRVMALPETLISPGPEWVAGYHAAARSTGLASGLKSLDAAVEAAGGCLNPLLSGEVRSGSWDPRLRDWVAIGG